MVSFDNFSYFESVQVLVVGFASTLSFKRQIVTHIKRTLTVRFISRGKSPHLYDLELHGEMFHFLPFAELCKQLQQL